MIYRKSPAHPPRLLLCVIAGATAVASIPACSSDSAPGSVVSPCETHLCGVAIEPDSGDPCSHGLCDSGVVGTAPFDGGTPDAGDDPCSHGICDSGVVGTAPFDGGADATDDACANGACDGGVHGVIDAAPPHDSGTDS